MTLGLSAEWQPDFDGILSRCAARVILINQNGRALLIRGHDFADSTKTWWFTPGGGILPEETPADTARRELAEETGIEGVELNGPVMRRNGLFNFTTVQARQYETYYVAYMSQTADITAAHWSLRERQLLERVEWWSATEMRRAAAAGERFFPGVLPEVIEWLAPGWDGQVREICDTSGENVG